MALMPKRVKHRKHQRGKMKGVASRGNTVELGDYGLQALEECWLSARQIEAGRVASTQIVRGEGRVFIRVFPDKPITATPAETRMGKGKGEPEFYAAVVRPGTVIFEVEGVPEEQAKIALARAEAKLPIKCRMIKRRVRI